MKKLCFAIQMLLPILVGLDFWRLEYMDNSSPIKLLLVLLGFMVIATDAFWITRIKPRKPNPSGVG